MVSFAVCVGKILYGVVMVWPVAVEVIAIVYELSCNRKHARIRQAREYPANQANHEAPAERSQPVSQSVAACVTLTCCLRLCCTRQS